MELDEDHFFRQASLRLQSTLDIENALREWSKYMIDFIPIDAIYFDVYNPQLRLLENILIIQTTDAFRGELDHEQVEPLPIEYSEIFEADSNTYPDTPGNPVRVWEHPVFVKIKNANVKGINVSNLSMALRLDEQELGNLSLLAVGEKRYNNHHAHLLSLLHEPFAVVISNTLKQKKIVKLDSLLAETRYSNQEGLSHPMGDDIIGRKFGLRVPVNLANQVSKSNSPVLIMGETGVGKDVIANFIHNSSPRAKGPFIKINCGAIPENLIDSDLFGHEKGAFTNAIDRKVGRFERADGGTLFLDEVGEFPSQAQVRLLRVLQHKEIERVGGTRVIHVDVRIISATNRNLEELINSGKFRRDLWYRLSVFPIHIPPLRSRKDDIPLFLTYFLEKKSYELKLPDVPKLAPGALDRLLAYDWPGNVRELENVIERELIITQTKRIGHPLSFKQFKSSDLTDENTGTAFKSNSFNLDENISALLQHALTTAKGKIYGKDGAAELLGINPNTLRSKMRKYGIPFEQKKRFRK